MKSLVLKNIDLVKKYALLMLGSAATFVALTATSKCPGSGYYEPEMPEHLYNEEY